MRREIGESEEWRQMTLRNALAVAGASLLALAGAAALDEGAARDLCIAAFTFGAVAAVLATSYTLHLRPPGGDDASRPRAFS